MPDRNASRLPDLADRRRAATGFDANLIVLAGAGTGKTSLLVERMLTAVGSGRTTIERIAMAATARKCSRLANSAPSLCSMRNQASFKSAVVCSVWPGGSFASARCAKRCNSSCTSGTSSSAAAVSPAW